MATDGPTPPPCNRDVFVHGHPLVLVTGSSNAVERWVQSLATRTHVMVDWHYSGGVAQVLYLGKRREYNLLRSAIEELKPTLSGSIIRVLSFGEQGRYRSGT